MASHNRITERPVCIRAGGLFHFHSKRESTLIIHITDSTRITLSDRPEHQDQHLLAGAIITGAVIEHDEAEG